MRVCVDCSTDISKRGRSAYLCKVCLHARHLEHDRRWHREHPESGRASQARQRLKEVRKRVCRACGSRRRKFRTYCEPCRLAFREISYTLAKKKYEARLRDQSKQSKKILILVRPRRVEVRDKRELLSRLKLKDLPLDVEWWSARLIQFPHLDIDNELSKAQDWYKADQIKSPKLFFRNWLEKAARNAPPQELTADQVRARLRIVS